MNSLFRAIIGFIGFIVGLSTVFVSGAQSPGSPSQPTPSGAPVAPTSSQELGDPGVKSGIDRPAILVPANKDQVNTRVILRGLDTNAAPTKDDLEIGLLTSSQQSSLLI